MKFPVSACPQALPVEAGISSYTTDIFLLIFTADARRSLPRCSYFDSAQHDSGGAQRDSSFFVIFYLGCKTCFAGGLRVTAECRAVLKLFIFFLLSFYFYLLSYPDLYRKTVDLQSFNRHSYFVDNFQFVLFRISFTFVR